MQSRVVRFVLVILVLAAGIGAALFSWNTSRQLSDLDLRQRDFNDRIDRLLASADAVTTAQQAYITPSSERQPERVPALIDQIRSETLALRPHVRSVDAGPSLQSVTDAVSTLSETESRAQEHLRLGQDLMAADLISSDARTATEKIGTGLRGLRAAESDAYAATRADSLKTAWIVDGGVALFWVLGLLLLVPRASTTASSEPTSLGSMHSLTAPSEPIPATVITAHPHPDLTRAADVCTAMSRLTTADELSTILRQAAGVLDASGIVIWMAAGEELFAASSFGYQPQVVRRLGPINRSAINATAAAWRLSATQIVPGDANARGALAIPMLGTDRCVGVLAIELSDGRQDDSSTKAVATMFAAQLSAALAGWPAASAAEPVTAPPLERAAEA